MTIISEFLRCVQRYEDNIALISEEEGSMSYKQLSNFSNYIASKLMKYKGKVDVVGVLLPRSFSLIATMLGIMRAGMAYLPLDPSYPIERIKWMLDQTNTNIVVCNDITKNTLDGSCELMMVDNTYLDVITDIEFCQNEDMACVLYTSGSTGMPNGVVMTHGAILNTLHWAIEFYSLNEKDVDMQVPSSSFTSSVQDIFTTLLSGGTLVMLNESKMLNARYLQRISEKYRVTHFDMVPSLYKEYLRMIKGDSTLRFVLLAGEPLHYKVVRNHFEKLPYVRIVNEYGMAESCSCCFVKEISENDTKIYIGRPISNMEYIINDIDQDGIGELYVSGEGLAAGYYNNFELTDKKFVVINQIRYLKTGDYVKEAEDKNLIYIGRRDSQVKVNGKKVNLSEIDLVLQKSNEVIDSITTSVIFKAKQLIVSFIRTRSENNSDYYKTLIREKLPTHYVPNYVKIVNDFLYLPNKKVNIRGLSEMFVEELNIEIMKNNEIYKKLVEIISKESEGLLVEPDFEKELQQQGIDSLGLIRLLAEIEEQFDFEFGYDDIDNLKIISVKSLYEYISAIKRL